MWGRGPALYKHNYYYYYVYCTVKIIYNSTESSAPRVFYDGESRFDDPEYSLWYYSQLFLHQCRITFFSI